MIPVVALISLPASSGITVVKYILEFPGFISKLCSLGSAWSSVPPAEFSVGVFSEERVLGLTSALLFSALSSHVTPGGAQLSMTADAQEQLLSLLSRSTTGVVARLIMLQTITPPSLPPRPPSQHDQGSTDVQASQDNGIHQEQQQEQPQEHPQDLQQKDGTVLASAKKCYAAQVNAGLLFLATLSRSLALLIGEGGCAPILRAVCAAAAWKAPANSTSTLCMVLQALFTTFSTRALAAVKELVSELRALRQASGEPQLTQLIKVEDEGDMKAETHPFLIHLEIVNKQLKDVQALTSGATSSKAD